MSNENTKMSTDEKKHFLMEVMGRAKTNNSLLHLLEKGETHQYPLFVHFLDAFFREKVKNKDQCNLDAESWTQKLVSIPFKDRKYIADGIGSFCRVIPPIQFNPPTKIWDSLKEICVYLTCIMDLIKKQFQSKHWDGPVQIDFMVAVNKCVKVNINDEYDTSDCVGDILNKIKDTHCYATNYISCTEAYDVLLNTYKEYEYSILNKYGKDEHKIYPNGRRFCILIDRRNKYESNKPETVIIFEPSKDGNGPVVSKNALEWQIYSLLTCLIPSADPKDIITIKSHCNGGLLTFSLFIQSLNLIKCYLACNGQITRFFAKDAVNALPDLFHVNTATNASFIYEDVSECIVAKLQPLQDLQFDMFYRSLYADNSVSNFVPIVESLTGKLKTTTSTTTQKTYQQTKIVTTEQKTYQKQQTKQELEFHHRQTYLSESAGNFDQDRKIDCISKGLGRYYQSKLNKQYDKLFSRFCDDSELDDEAVQADLEE
eukprot:17073_1